MRILIEGYLDRNFGDDMIIILTALNCPEHEFYIDCSRRELFIPFENVKNIHSGMPEKYDKRVIATGAGFCIRSKRALLYLLNTLFKADEKSGFIIGANVGPFYSSFAKRIMMKRLKRFEHISLRDEYSYNLLVNEGFNNVSFYPDILFSLPESRIPEKTNEKILGISAYRSITGGDNYHMYTEFARAADYYIENSGGRVMIFAFDCEDENDLCAAHTIYSMMKHNKSAEIVAHMGNGGNIIKAFSRLDRLISVRFHSVVLGLRMEISQLVFAYGEKTLNMLHDIGYDRKILKTDSVNLNDIIDFIDCGGEPFAMKKEIYEKAGMHFEILHRLTDKKGGQ